MATTFETTTTAFNFKQRAVSLTLGIACTVPLTSTVALAYTPVPQAMPTLPNASAGWQHTAATASQHAASVTSNAAAASFASYAAGTHTTVVHTLAPVLNHNALAGNQAAASTGVLNLASSQLSFLAGNLGNFQSLTINVGGKQEVVNLTTRLTAAEVVAVQQVLTGAGQTIAIRANGVASGGTVTLNNSLLNALDGSVGGSLNSLTVAKGVQVVDTLSSLTLAGGLSNYGSILTAASTNGSSDTISAGTVLNARGGSIGSYTTGSGLYGADVNLNASNSLTNNGLIGSAGNVNISANTINNTGTIAAVTGNVNLTSTGALTLNGSGGTLQANHGNVNFATNNADIAVNGGNVLSQQVNYSAGTGNVNANMDQVTGVVNASGNNVHIYGNTAVLSLGSIEAANDPLFVNTTGDVDLKSATTIPPLTATNGAPLTVIAAGSIYDTGASITLDSSSKTTSGGAITLIAGATVTGGTGVASVVTKGSTSGGFIDLTGTNLNNDGSTGAVALNSSSSAPGVASAGGNVQLIAFAGKTAGSGEVFTTTINSSSTNGPAGNVTIIAGAKTGTAVQTGAITATSGGGAAPLISVSASTPLIVVTTKGAKGVDFDATGAQTANAFGPTKTANAGGIVLGNVDSTGPLNITTAASASVANTGNDLDLGTIIVGKTGTFTASNTTGAINYISTITGGTTTLTVTGAGAINNGSALASINTTNLNLNVGTSNASVVTDVANLQFTGLGGSVIDDQTLAKTVLPLNISGTSTGATDVIVSSTGQVNVVGLTQVSGNNLTINATGKGGIAVNALITVGTPSTGEISLNNAGTGKLTELKGTVISANQVEIDSTTSFGSKTAPIVTAETGKNAVLGFEDLNPKNSSYLSDQSTVDVTFQGGQVAVGGSLFLTSTAPTLTANNAGFTNVSLADTSTSAGSTGLVLTGTIGNPAGVTTVTSATGIAGTGTIAGKTVTLNTGGNIGAAAALLVTTPILTIVSKGSIKVSDNVPVTVTSSGSLNSALTTNITDTATGDAKTGASLTVGKAITGGAIFLSTTNGGIISTGPVGTSSTAQVQLTSSSFITTKGAILGGNLKATAAGLLNVDGAIGQTGSTVVLATTGPSTNTLTVAGVVTGNTISITSVGQVITTKAINGTDANSFVVIRGVGTASSNYATIGGAITGEAIEILPNASTGGVAVNTNVGLLASSSLVLIEGGLGAAPNAGAITGKGVIAGQTVDLESNTGIGTSKAAVNTQAANLFLNTFAGGSVPAFIAQKGNLSLFGATDSALTMKVSGNLDVTGTVTVPNLTLTSTGTTSVSGKITDGGTVGAIAITSVGFTAYSGSNLTTAAASTLTLDSTAATNLNGTVAGGKFTVNSTGLLTIGTTGSVIDAADTLTSKGGITMAGTLGNAADVLAVSTTGALQIGLPNQSATVTGAGNLTGASITNYGNSFGSINYVATGAGTATAPSFANFGTIGQGNNVDTVSIDSKGSIATASTGTISAANLSLVSAGSAAINLGGTGTTDLTGATVKTAFTIGAGTGNVTFGGAAVGSVTAGSVNLNFANTSAKNALTLTVNSVATTTGDLTVNSNARNLDVGAAANLTTKAGNINLQNTNTNGAANITFADNVIVHASGAASNLNQGNVSIFMGAAGYTPSTGSKPATVTLAGTTTGQIFFSGSNNAAGAAGTITSGTSTLTSIARNLSLNTGAFGSAAIVLGNGDQITADPPVGGASTVTTSVTAINPINTYAIAPSTPTIATAAATAANSQSLSALTFNPSVITATVSNANSNDNQGLTPGFLSSNATIDTVESIIDGVGTGTRLNGSGKATKKALQGGVSNAGHTTLNQGALLLSPEQNTVVDTAFGSVSVAANSMVLVIASANGLSVYNLHDAHKNAVVINGEHGSVALTPGRSAVIASASVSSFEEANQAPFVPYRRLVSKELGSNAKLYQADFDLVSMVRGLPAFKKMAGDAKQRSAVDSVLKTAAIMAQISGGSEPYALYLTPSLSACAISTEQR